jgi:hypothetical protein
MITITYQYSCDVCDAKSDEDETYRILPFMPAQDTALPRPRYRNPVGMAHVCDSCFCKAAAALRAPPKA